MYCSAFDARGNQTSTGFCRTLRHCHWSSPLMMPTLYASHHGRLGPWATGGTVVCAQNLHSVVLLLHHSKCRQGLSALQQRKTYSTIQQAQLAQRVPRHEPGHHRLRCHSLSGHSAVLQHDTDPGGESSGAANGATETPEDPRMLQLDQEIAEMRQLLSSQQKLLKQQEATISDLKLLLEPPPAKKGVVRPFDAQRAAYTDRRLLGMYDARFHSTCWGATPKEFRVLPKKIILVRHAESEGNVDSMAYTYVPDPQVPLTPRGHQQAQDAGLRIKKVMEADGQPYKLYFYMSPYKRSQQTFEGLKKAFHPNKIAGWQEEVQLREQDFGNFQDAEGKQREKAERLRFGRFFYRFPNGESGADVYDRMTIFEDHMVRDINAGRFAADTSLVLVTHGLALRVFLMRWFHWSVDQFLNVYNPPNAEPLVLERPGGSRPKRAWAHTKSLYRLSRDSQKLIRGCSDDMCYTSTISSLASMDEEMMEQDHYW
eukprot:jgi/Botrbrau1/23073/Bobra.0243s0014.1